MGIRRKCSIKKAMRCIAAPHCFKVNIRICVTEKEFGIKWMLRCYVQL